MSAPFDETIVPKPRRAWAAWLVALGLGFVGWWLGCLVSGRREAWDSAFYGQAVYPAFALGAAALGYWQGRHAWRWPLAIALGQGLALFVRDPLGNLAPLGVIVLGIYCVPLLLPAVLGSRVRGWVEQRRA